MDAKDYIGIIIYMNGKHTRIQSYDEDHDVFLIVGESGDEADEWCIMGETIRTMLSKMIVVTGHTE